MEILVKNTTSGLVPLHDDDFDEKRKLKLNEVYKVRITKARNVEFHRKYFALINIGWEYMNETQTAFFRNSKEGFRRTVQVQAGFYDERYSIARNEWLQESKSISFDNMDEIEFKELYTKVRDVIFSLIEGNVSEEEFIHNLSNF